ncbi:MAG: PEGA domain-containing protein [Gemmatimonadales bacterium]
MRWYVVGALAMVAMAGAAGLAGCATIMHGSSQELSIASSPIGARVLVDGQEHGRTPLVADLKRKDKHVVRIELDGYLPYEVALARGTSGWVWGNIVFGGLIGLAVDAITGGLYQLEPREVSAAMARSTAAITAGNGTLVVAVVLRPNPAWERIGDLARE